IEEILIRELLESCRRPVFVINEYEIDIRRYVELAAAELAHTDDDQLLRPAAIRADRLAMGLRQSAVMQADGGIDRMYSETRHRRADFDEVGAAGKIAQQGPQYDVLSAASQRLSE